MKKILLKVVTVLLVLVSTLAVAGLVSKQNAAAETKKVSLNFVSFMMLDNSKVEVTGVGAFKDAENIQVNNNVLTVDFKVPAIVTEKDNSVVVKHDNVALNGNVVIKAEEVNEFKDGQVITMYQGAGQQGDVEGHEKKNYFLNDLENATINILFFDPANNYKDKTGLHHWNTIESSPEWGKPSRLFVVGKKDQSNVLARSISGKIENGSTSLGALVYASNDETKYTGDINAEKLPKTFADLTPGAVRNVYIFDGGLANTSNNNVFENDDFASFAKTAFAFQILPFGKVKNNFVGTYAVNPNTLFLEFNISMKFFDQEPKQDQDLRKQAKEELKSYIKVVEKETGAELEIESINYNEALNVVKNLVVNLKTPIDNTKEYLVKVKNDKQAIDAEQVIDVDKEAPVIDFDKFLDVDPDKVIIEVPYNKAFDTNLFPSYVVNDNRDGDITFSLYVPGADEKNEKRFVDPSQKGVYEILVKAVDKWGNVAERTLKFQVK